MSNLSHVGAHKRYLAEIGVLLWRMQRCVLGFYKEYKSGIWACSGRLLSVHLFCRQAPH